MGTAEINGDVMHIFSAHTYIKNVSENIDICLDHTQELYITT